MVSHLSLHHTSSGQSELQNENKTIRNCYFQVALMMRKMFFKNLPKMTAVVAKWSRNISKSFLSACNRATRRKKGDGLINSTISSCGIIDLDGFFVWPFIFVQKLKILQNEEKINHVLFHNIAVGSNRIAHNDFLRIDSGIIFFA